MIDYVYSVWHYSCGRKCKNCFSPNMTSVIQDIVKIVSTFTDSLWSKPFCQVLTYSTKIKIKILWVAQQWARPSYKKRSLIAVVKKVSVTPEIKVRVKLIQKLYPLWISRKMYNKTQAFVVKIFWTGIKTRQCTVNWQLWR